MRKLAVSLSKGGVGKSSSSVTIAHGLALRGKKVLLVDTDEQGHDAILLGVTTTYGLSSVLNEDVSTNKAIYLARKNLWILSGNKALSKSKETITQKIMGREKALQEILEPIENDFDYIIIDTSPSFDVLTINALYYATEVITPVSLEVLSLTSLVDFIKSIEAVKKYNKNLIHRYILPTFLDGRVKKSEEVFQQIKDHFPDQLLSPIKYNVRLSECAGFGKTVFEFAPNSTGAQDYKKVVDRIIKDEKE